MLEHSPELFEIMFKFISVQGLMHISTSHCGPSMRTINAEVENSSIPAIQSVCQASPNLTYLRLTFDDSNVYTDAMILTAVQYCPMIKVLPTQSWASTDTALNALATIHTLTELHLLPSSCTSAAVHRVIQSNRNLTLINVSVDNLDDALVRCIGDCCRNLRALSLYISSLPSITDSRLQDLFRGCPLLESFHLSQPGGVSNTALRALFEYCPHLTDVGFSGAMPATPPPAGEPVLHAHYPCLTKLTVREYGVADSALQSILTHCTNLREVHIRECNHITDETIKVLALQCTSLDIFKLTSCTNITIAGVLEVATHCTSLTKLALRYMPISDEVLILLSLHCSGLTILSMVYCNGELITEAGILAVAEGCTSLTSLCIVGNLLMPLTPTLALLSERQVYTHIKSVLFN